jgi:hypothetical protein
MVATLQFSEGKERGSSQTIIFGLNYRVFKKKELTMVMQMLLCGECYEDVYI